MTIPVPRKSKKTGSKIAYKSALDELNAHLRKIKGAKTSPIYPSVAHDVFQRYNSRCAFCGISLSVRNTRKFNSLRFLFYIPLREGGSQDIDNIIPTCLDCFAVDSHKRRSLIQDIPDINTFSDLLEQLIISTAKYYTLYQEEDPNYFFQKDKSQIIKRLINLKLEEILIAIRYNFFKDFPSENFEILEEETNSFSDIVELGIKSVLDDDSESTSKIKEKLTNQVKQISKTRQYRIIKNKKNAR